MNICLCKRSNAWFIQDVIIRLAIEYRVATLLRQWNKASCMEYDNRSNCHFGRIRELGTLQCSCQKHVGDVGGGTFHVVKQIVRAGKLDSDQ